MLRMPATFDRFSSRADGSFGLGFTSQEASLDELAMLSGHVRKFGWLLFSENEIQDSEVPTEKADDDSKTPSQRLRGVQFLYWKKEIESTGKDFEGWRRGVFEKWIEYYKDKLD